MFYIDHNTPEFIDAKNEHFVNVRYIIKKKLLGEHFSEPHPKGLKTKIRQVPRINSKVKTFLRDDNNLRDVLIGTPDVLDGLKNLFPRKKERESIKKLVRYDAFIEKESTFSFYNGYDLAGNIPFGTCIYCNRLYTHTIITAKGECVARPTFDHWFPKAIYPLLALSFYNLIPSCNVCNSSVKGTQTLDLVSIFHPYYKHSQTKNQLKFRFSYTMEDHLRAESKIKAANKFTRDSLAVMKTKDLYSLHHEDIRDLIFLKKVYSAGHLNSLQKLLKMSIQPEEIYRLAFGVHLKDSELVKRPLSKMKKDILRELGIIA